MMIGQKIRKYFDFRTLKFHCNSSFSMTDISNNTYPIAELDRKTLPQLKQIVKDLGISYNINKAPLIIKILEHNEKKNGEGKYE